MGLLARLIRSGLDPESRKLLEWIEKEVQAGRMSQSEAEERRADLENSLRHLFDSEEEKDKDNA